MHWDAVFETSRYLDNHKIYTTDDDSKTNRDFYYYLFLEICLWEGMYFQRLLNALINNMDGLD